MKQYFKVNRKVKFQEESKPYKVMAVSENYAICSRKLNKRVDSDILYDLVDNGVYLSFKEAYNECKDSPIYTIVDFKNEIRGSDDLIFSMFDYFDKDDCNEAIQMLEHRRIGISNRTRIKLNLG